MKTNNLIACAECDALQREVPLADNGRALCVRCGAELYRHGAGRLDRTLAFSLAAAVVFVIANSYPIMSLDARGLRTGATLVDTAATLWDHDMPSVAALVLVTTWLMPIVQLAAMIYMLVPLRQGMVPARIHLAYRLANWAQPWAMVEVFLLGALVSLVKLTQVAQVEAGPGIYALGAYAMLLAAAVSAFEPRELWRRVQELNDAPEGFAEGARP